MSQEQFKKNGVTEPSGRWRFSIQELMLFMIAVSLHLACYVSVLQNRPMPPRPWLIALVFGLLFFLFGLDANLRIRRAILMVSRVKVPKWRLVFRYFVPAIVLVTNIVVRHSLPEGVPPWLRFTELMAVWFSTLQSIEGYIPGTIHLGKSSVLVDRYFVLPWRSIRECTSDFEANDRLVLYPARWRWLWRGPLVAIVPQEKRAVVEELLAEHMGEKWKKNGD